MIAILEGAFAGGRPEPWQAVGMSSPLPPNQEYVRREIIAAALATRAESTGGYLRWSELAEFPLPDGTMERLVDPGRGGIWNPRGYAATLTIVTSPDGPYPDREIDGGSGVHPHR
ncbi:hypothetical protein GCM10023153_20600 [Ornithinibacter aureus]|uniref:Uncharacterized protein n=1 Tax=Ornithinibacter aureus TaxID=622664 RepID=A0ABP8JX39_9MICO